MMAIPPDRPDRESVPAITECHTANSVNIYEGEPEFVDTGQGLIPMEVAKELGVARVWRWTPLAWVLERED
jgi:hypothetical protein